ncbi:helix-turn-helix transcriptional regulator [Virgibacillus siamensis]|uniref:helix-turn-helix transcriptional regulator n=1 Tax=Virgibacillus siamensis TaxID=480071 RepID=UPI0009870403|nr:AraC family transcriptional regulator [Virgibacillus siamensis]
MKNELILCEYSYHTEKKHFNWKNGLENYLIRLQTEGHCFVKINNNSTFLSPGDLLLCKPGDSCELIIDPNGYQEDDSGIHSGDYFVICRGPWIDKWWDRTNRPSINQLHFAEKLLSLWKEIIKEKRRIYDKNEELLDYLLRSLCLSIDGSIKDFNTTQTRLPLSVRSMKNYIEEHANQPFKVQDVALHAGFSPSHASHLFKEKFGKTIIGYAMEIRLNTAVKLIKYSDMSLERIAELSGFGSYTYFHRVFKKSYGTSPTEYFSGE